MWFGVALCGAVVGVRGVVFVVWCGVHGIHGGVWCGVVRCGVVNVVWCDVVWRGVGASRAAFEVFAVLGEREGPEREREREGGRCT